MKIIDLIILEQRFRIKLRATTRAQVDIVKQIADILNANVEMYASSVVDGVRQFTDRRGAVHTGNAAYIPGTNTIVIDINAGDTLNGLVLNSLSHEVVHYIKEMSPDKFRKLADFVVGKFGEKGVSVTKLIRAKQSKYAAQGQELSFMDAYEEVVADSVESMLSQKTEKIVSDIAEMRKVDADLAKTFVDKVKDLIGKMLNVFKKNKFQSNPETEEGKFFAKWSEFGDELSGIFAEAAADAADKAAQAARRTDTVSENKKSADDAADGVFENSQPMKNMLRSGFEADMDDFNLRRTSFGRQLADWRSNQGAAGGSYNGHYFELGKTPRSLIKHGAPDVSLIMYDDCLVKITGGKHDTALEEIAKIPQELSDPILLFKGSVPNSFVAVTEIQTKQGHEAIVAVHINRRHGRNVINKIASLHSRTTDYGKNYIVEYVKNQIHAGNLVDASAKKAPTWFTTRGLQLPKVVQTIIDANNSISNPVKKINPSDEKNSRRNLNERQIIVDMLKSLPYEVEHGGIGIIMAQIIRT